MKFYISYFYQIRHMTPNIIPLSTAVYPPKWFDKGDPYFDKNGVLNGVTCDLFVPGPQLQNLCKGSQNCTCDNKTCDFLQGYREQLSHITKDQVEYYGKAIGAAIGMSDPDIALIVYETPDNPCSERGPIIEWFKNNGMEITEFYPA